MAEGQELTVSIEISDGETDAITLPADLIDRLAEEGDTTAQVVGDVAVLAFAGRAHAIAHHTEGTDEAFEATEDRMMDLFEERFGVTYAEATGHHH